MQGGVRAEGGALSADLRCPCRQWWVYAPSVASGDHLERWVGVSESQHQQLANGSGPCWVCAPGMVTVMVMAMTVVMVMVRNAQPRLVSRRWRVFWMWSPVAWFRVSEDLARCARVWLSAGLRVKLQRKPQDRKEKRNKAKTQRMQAHAGERNS